MKKKFSDGAVRGPYTNTELFELIDSQLKAAGLRPAILDYSLAESTAVQMDTYEWDCFGIVNFGCEGIYLDLYADGIITRQNETGTVKKERVRLGVYKTLHDSKTAYMIMCRLMTEFVFALREFVNEHMDRFTWRGFDLNFYRNEKYMWGFSELRTWEDAIARAKETKAQYPFDYCVIVENKTGNVERKESYDL